MASMTLPEAGKKGNDADHGNRFQSKLLILYAVRAIQLNYDFYFETELSIGEKFDDLVFYFKDEQPTDFVTNKTTVRQQYLQAKNRLNENVCITSDQLIKKNETKETLKTNNDTGDFSLLKYFQSYIKIRSQGNDIEHCIICINVDFNQNDLQRNGITLELVDKEKWPKLLDCANVKPQQSCYKLKVAYDKFKSISCERKRKWIENFTKNDFEYLFENCTDEKIINLFVNCPPKVNEKPFHTAAEIKNLFNSLKDLKEKGYTKEMYLTNFFQNCDETIVSAVFEGFFFFLDDFLNKLVFAVKMPGEEELDPILTKEVGDYFQLSNADLQSAYVMNKMVNWFKKEKNLWLTAEAAEKFLKNEAGELIKLSHRTSLSIDYQRQTLKLGVLKFEDEVVCQLTDILEEFWNSQEKIKSIKSETPKLTAVKVISAIQKMKGFPNDDNYLVISSKKLKENVNELEESKRAEKCHHLFVIVDEDAKNPLENDSSYQNSIPLDMKKKMIVISKNVSSSDSADPITFGKFHEDTKNKIRNIKVLFQGIYTSVGGLIEESQLDELDSKFIENLLYAENKTYSVPSFNSGFNSSFYIQRTLKFPQKLVEALDTSKKKGNNGKKCSKMDRNNLNFRIDSNGKIHWLIDDDKRKKEIWEKLKLLIEQNESKDGSLLNEFHSNNNRIIITGVAGTGKSTILSHYYEEIKKVNPDKLVIKISLMNYSESLMNEKSINEFLINNVMGQNAFARQLLKHRLETGDRIILMLDGFNEIDNYCQKKVVELVKTLDESISLYITSRPHMADQLEFKLSQLAYSLDKFTKEDQIDYLTSIWEEYLTKDKVAINDNKIETFARQLTDRVSETLKDKEKEFLGIPLQCRILAECFQSKIKDEIIQKPNADLSHLIGNQQFDVADLYKSLIDEKRRIFRKEKFEENSREDHIAKESIENTINKTERHLQKLAIQLIVNYEEDVDILIPSAGFHSKSEREKKEKQLNEFGIRFGLLDDKGENGIQFLHRTFAEYLVADYVFNGFLLDEEKYNKLLAKESARKWIIEEMLMKDNYEGVRVFFDSMLKEIIFKEEWRNRIQNNYLPRRLQQLFASFKLKEEIPALKKAFIEMNSNISLLIFDCLDVTFHETPSKIPPVIYHSLGILHIFRQVFSTGIFRQRIDVFDRLFNYFDNAFNKDLLYFTGSLIPELKMEKQQIENKKLERFLVFVGRHRDVDWVFESLMDFFIRRKMDEQTRKQFFEILSSKYSTDFYLTGLMEKSIITSLKQCDCHIGEIKNALTILRNLGRIEVAGEMSRLVLFRRFETLKKEENANVRLSLEKIGMIGLHGAAFRGDSKFIKREIGCCSLQNPQKCSEEKRKSVVRLMTNWKDSVPPLYLAATYGQDNICKKIFRFLDLKKEISDKNGFLHRSLKDAIQYQNVVMFRTILKCVKEILARNDLIKLLKSVIYYCRSKLVVETIVSIVLQDKENGYRDLNDLVFYDWGTLRILEHVECGILQKMITAEGGLDNWIKRLMDFEDGFQVLSSDGFLNKLNQENQTSKLIDILITRSKNTRASPKVLTRIVSWWRKMSERRQPSTSYWSNFVTNIYTSSMDMKEFLAAISKCASEEDLKRLLLYRDDNNILILLEYLIKEGREKFNGILTNLPENLRKEIEDLSEEEKPKLIDHFFSTPFFLESLHRSKLLNAIEYYLENGNENQLEKFSQVVKVHHLEKIKKLGYLKLELEFGKMENRNKIAGLLKEKLDSQTVDKYNEFIKICSI